MAEVHPEHRRTVRAGQLGTAQDRAVATEHHDQLDVQRGLLVVVDDLDRVELERLGLVAEQPDLQTGVGQQPVRLPRHLDRLLPAGVRHQQHAPRLVLSHPSPAFCSLRRGHCVLLPTAHWGPLSMAVWSIVSSRGGR